MSKRKKNGGRANPVVDFGDASEGRGKAVAKIHYRAKKSLGQNFLMHQATAERIADAAELSLSDTVLEVGPGTGMLTRTLLTRAGRVVAVEADDELIPKLQKEFEKPIEEGRLTLIHGDIRTSDLSSILSHKPYKLVANIPYYLTGELIRSVLSGNHKPETMTLLVQKEVGERIARAKKESLLSLAVKVYGHPHYRFTVPKGAFVPKPNVDSAVISVTDIANHFADVGEEERFFLLIRTGFMHKRKLLIKNLEALTDKVSLQEAFASLSLSPQARAETLSLLQWKELAKKLTF